MRPAVAPAELPPGTKVVSAGGRREGSIVRLLGAGGQGTVYEIAIGDARFALKWYHDHYVAIDRTLRARLTRAVERGAPTASFLWPMDVMVRPGAGSFGYVMPLRDPAYVGMRALIARPPDRVELSLEQRMTLCARIADSFLELHASGFCYQDINFGNFFLHPTTADVLICDNDNVNVDGAEASIYGTRKFMAPEVVRREALPSTTTDLFSMAVLFFYTLLSWHPLDGRREAGLHVLDAAAELSLYGTEPAFLFDPEDDTNGPVPGAHDPLVARWRSLSPTLRELFVRSFTAGLHQPSRRVLEYEWRAAFLAAHASVFACSACAYEHCAEVAGGAAACARCGAGLALPPIVVIGRAAFAARPGRTLLRHCTAPGGSPDFDAVAGTVERHPCEPNVVGLCNRTEAAWRVRVPGRADATVAPGKTVRLVPGLEIGFGATVGRVTVAGG